MPFKTWKSYQKRARDIFYGKFGIDDHHELNEGEILMHNALRRREVEGDW